MKQLIEQGPGPPNYVNSDCYIRVIHALAYVNSLNDRSIRVYPSYICFYKILANVPALSCRSR